MRVLPGLLVGVILASSAAFTVTPAATADETAATFTIPGLTGIVDLAGRGRLLAAIDAEGRVWVWGQEFAPGEIGNGTRATQAMDAPIQVPIGARVTAISEVDGALVALDDTGTVWAWGDNSIGQIADGTRRTSSTPKKIAGLPRITSIAGGVTLALDTNGKVWRWGQAPAVAGTRPNYYSLKVEQVRLAKRTTDLWASNTWAYARLSDGSLWGWGYSPNIGLGNGAGDGIKAAGPARILSTTRAMGFSDNTLFAIAGNGSVRGWGYNYYTSNVLGPNGRGRNARTPIRVAGLRGIAAIATDTNAAVALADDGSVLTWGVLEPAVPGPKKPLSKTPEKVPGLSAVADITMFSPSQYANAGPAFYARLSDGSVYGWGYSKWNSLGFKTTNVYTLTPTRIPVGPVRKLVSPNSGIRFVPNNYPIMYAVLSDGTVAAWGFAVAGQNLGGFDCSKPSLICR